MKKVLLSMLLIQVLTTSKAQTLTYSNFSVSLSDTIPINVANNNSFNSSLTSTTGNGVVWDASALNVMAGFPTVNLSFHNPSSTPHASLYTSSNYVEYDPALTAFVSYKYYGINADSLVSWGSYDPSSAHEIFQNPDKHLIFPFSYGQSFVDTYAKTNYSDATTISSYQNGTRTVTFSGYGDLILPQGLFTNVAFIAETRTNNLGPVSYYYTWYDITNGKKLLFRSENGSSITTAWCADPSTATAIGSVQNELRLEIFPNPASHVVNIKLANANERLQITLFSATGEQVASFNTQQDKIQIETANFPEGIYFIRVVSGEKSTTNKVVIIR